MVFGIGLFWVAAASASRPVPGPPGPGVPPGGMGSALPKELYVGCRPSAGECFHSCPTHRALVRVEPENCDPEDYLRRYACYCTFDGET